MKRTEFVTIERLMAIRVVNPCFKVSEKDLNKARRVFREGATGETKVQIDLERDIYWALAYQIASRSF